MRHLSLAVLCFLILNHTLAQKDTSKLSQPDSATMATIRARIIENAAILNPRLRQFYIAHEEQGTSDITSKYKDGTEASSGTFRIERTLINMNMPILQRGKSTLISSYGFVNQIFHIGTNMPNGSVENTTKSMQMLTAGLTYATQQKLFGKDLTIIGMTSGLFTASFDKAQLTAMAIASLTLKRTATTQMSVGAAFLYDPSSPSPFLPTFSYYHKFTDANLDFMLDLPYRLSIRRQFSQKFSLAFSNDMIGYNSFFDQANLTTDNRQKFVYSYLEVKSGFLAEYRLGKKAILSLSSGINSPLKSRIFENYSKPNDYLIKNNLHVVPYVQIGFSMLPFWNGLNL
ncbi:DUF6268 family outer membrane beta-barrel protein [Rhizosphaericola mali]|uniref:DUF6268 domain-containing protein n=1 Tax=Rhizosphaericola mali TaxID=2545455 RepID=A0A5P2GA79_9BACT|nr:DUF6268 family outer membrane beta-barrel protein [Rhizosphaericola mali]QES88451.1 hypothetical protein E0W69_007175 [Rhizosphaericola mali]